MSFKNLQVMSLSYNFAESHSEAIATVSLACDHLLEDFLCLRAAQHLATVSAEY